MKKTILATILILFLASATGNVLLTQPDTDSDISDLDKSYRIGFINTGDQKLNLSISNSSDTGLKLDYPERIILEPSKITDTPSREKEWYYLGDGNYAEIHYLEIKAEIPPDTETRSHSFDLLITRAYETDKERPNVETVREFNFDLFSTSDLIQTGFTSENPEKEDKESKSDKTNENESDTENRKPEDEIEEMSQQERNNTETNQKEESDPVTGVTIILSIGVILTMAWLLREVFA